MRLHRLSMTAFGPFAGTEVVDFDALSAAGLFLLHGPTGSGKTSVLDAVCYALYGQVPGARAGGRLRLRSDHAPADREPRVQLELTVGSRRIEVTRSPEWSRPKKRGTGTTTAPAATHVRELVADDWVALTTRNDEAGQLLTDLLGMGLEQFTKVVLLPQGDFAAFLRSDAEARRSLLSRLFSIDRFTGVEAALSERRRGLAADVQIADHQTGTLLARAGEVFAGLPATDDLTDHLGDEDPGDLKPAHQVAALLERAVVIARATEVEHEVRTERAGVVHGLLERGRELDARQRRHRDVTGRLAVIDETAAAHGEAVRRIAAARRAAPLMGLLDGLAAADVRTERLRCVATAARAALPSAATDDDEPALRARLLAHRGGVGALDGCLEREAELTATLARIEALTAEQAQAVTQVEAATAARTAAATELERARQAGHAAAVAAADEGPAVAAQAAAIELAERVIELADAQLQVAAAEQSARAAVDDDQWAREQQLGLWQRRITDIAAELAAGLQPGQPCQVCGSRAHPQVATPSAEHVGRDEVEAATAAADTSRAHRELAERELAAVLAHRSDLLARTGGVEPAQAQAQLLRAQDRFAAATTAKALAERERLAVEAADASLRQAEADQHRFADVVSRAAAALVELTRVSEAATADLTRLRGEDPDVRSRCTRLQTEIAAFEELLGALAGLRVAEESVTDHRERLERACAECGFDGVVGAQAAVLPLLQIEALDDAVAARERERGDLLALLADADLAGVLDQPEPDLVLLAADVAQADRELQRAGGHSALARDGVRRLTQLVREVGAHQDATAPLLDAFDRVDQLCSCVTGTGGDNALRMRLSAYVLAARLEEVAAAATERLDTMTGGRYALVHSDERAKGGGRSGLGLRVVDSWTGVERDTSTLSGGESFVASLALALGLADVVQAESGGTVIETLFVDEGFGTLDEDTLDEVMTTLDGLRAGGRAVGLVSHVLDLRTRIPTQLEVRKTRAGSTLSQQVSR